MTALPSFLTDEKAHLPSGGQFQPSGLISKWVAGILYRVGWVEEDITSMGFEVDGVTIARSESSTGKYRYVFRNHELANKVNDEVGRNQFPPETIWRFVTNPDDVLNFGTPDARSKFGDHIEMDAVVKTLGSKKYRHEFHLVAMPYAVQSMAILLGYLDAPVFNTNELIIYNLPPREGEEDEEKEHPDLFFERMCGHPEDDKGWATSVLGTRRAQLWAALGESNPAVSRSSDTESEQLKNCFAIFENVMKEPMWARIVNIPNPAPYAVYVAADGSEKRVGIPALTTIYVDEVAANTAAQEELERRSRPASEPAQPTQVEAQNNGVPAVPEKWRQFGVETFVENFQALLDEEGSDDAYIIKTLDLTKPEYLVWKKHLANQ